MEVVRWVRVLLFAFLVATPVMGTVAEADRLGRAKSLRMQDGSSFLQLGVMDVEGHPPSTAALVFAMLVSFLLHVILIYQTEKGSLFDNGRPVYFTGHFSNWILVVSVVAFALLQTMFVPAAVNFGRAQKQAEAAPSSPTTNRMLYPELAHGP